MKMETLEYIARVIDNLIHKGYDVRNVELNGSRLYLQCDYSGSNITITVDLKALGIM